MWCLMLRNVASITVGGGVNGVWDSCNVLILEFFTKLRLKKIGIADKLFRARNISGNSLLFQTCKVLLCYCCYSGHSWDKYFWDTWTLTSHTNQISSGCIFDWMRSLYIALLIQRDIGINSQIIFKTKKRKQTYLWTRSYFDKIS